MAGRLDTEQLQARIDAGHELALLDVREEGEFARGHLLWAVCMPLSRLELQLAARVPRRTVPVVLCDDGEQRAERAAERLAAFGYTCVDILDGGIAAWAAAGGELFSGVNVPSKAFGEFVEHSYHTPSIDAGELHRLIEAGADVMVLDSRPLDEFQEMSIPTAICTPGAELLYRLQAVAPAADTVVVVNCAGRTRSIIGAQSLINAGVPNRVLALRNGTMGWQLAGLPLQRGAEPHLPAVDAAAVAVARQRGAAVARRFGVPWLDHDELAELRAERERSLFVLDVRGPQEYLDGHLPGSRSAPGGQLVQATDAYVGVRGARLVLVDDDGVRASLTASWLLQMGWREVWVLRDGLRDVALECGSEHLEVLGLEGLEVDLLSAAELSRLRRGEAVTVIDLSLSSAFRRAHLPGARHCVRSRLAQCLATIDDSAWLVFTCENGLLARFGAAEASVLGTARCAALMGGNAAWREAGLELASGSAGLDRDPDDVWLKPFEHGPQAMRDYLDWEQALVAQLERDGTARFQRSPGARSAADRRPRTDEDPGGTVT